MTFKKKNLSFVGIILVGICLLLGVQFFNVNEKSIENTVFADQRDVNLDVKENVSKETAQQYVDFRVVVPDAESDLEQPIIHVVEPPEGAVSDEKLARQLTRIESFYVSKNNKKDEGIAIVQTNNEIVQMDENGQPLKAETIDINGTKINSYECDCKPVNKTLLWWYDGKVTTEVTVYGDTNIQKAHNIVKKILKDR